MTDIVALLDSILDRPLPWRAVRYTAVLWAIHDAQQQVVVLCPGDYAHRTATAIAVAFNELECTATALAESTAEAQDARIRADAAEARADELEVRVHELKVQVSVLEAQQRLEQRLLDLV